jgi:hypothetical protein
VATWRQKLFLENGLSVLSSCVAFVCWALIGVILYFHDTGRYDAKVDIFALGVVMFRLCTLEMPYDTMPVCVVVWKKWWGG